MTVEQPRGRHEGLVRKREPLVLLYTGHGKGKTSSALGVTMRAWGRGWKICWLQFIKSKTANYGETRAAARMGIEMIPLGDGFTWLSKDIEHDIALARECWALAREKIESGAYDLVVLDEITYPITYGWLDVDEVIAALRERPADVHLILTGRDAAPRAGRVRRPRDGDDRGQAPLPARHQGPARPRLLTCADPATGGKGTGRAPSLPLWERAGGEGSVAPRRGHRGRSGAGGPG